MSTEMTKDQLRKVFSILRDFPDDYSKAAREVNVSRALLMETLSTPVHVKNLQTVKDSYLDSVTSSYKNWVRGISVTPDFNGAHALKILERERPEIWAPKSEERNKASDSKEKKPKNLLQPLPNIDFNKPPPKIDRPVPLSDLVVTEEDLHEFDLHIQDV